MQLPPILPTNSLACAMASYSASTLAIFWSTNVGSGFFGGCVKCSFLRICRLMDSRRYCCSSSSFSGSSQLKHACALHTSRIPRVIIIARTTPGFCIFAELGKQQRTSMPGIPLFILLSCNKASQQQFYVRYLGTRAQGFSSDIEFQII